MISTDLKFLSLQNRCKGGSLPLKKRRFSSISELEMDSSSEAASALASLSSAAVAMVGSFGGGQAQQPPPALQPAASPSGLAALSLVAAAAQTSAHEEEAPAPHDEESKTTLLPPGQEEPLADPESCETAKRFPAAPLDQPLPGGCHGRTSRNNSFCRRQPCYKGSRFCKLHYQQREARCVAVTASPSAKEESTGPKQKKSKTSKSSSLSLNNNNQAAAAPPRKASIQDKRFSGAEGEVRCQATTTRGRECAYISVSGSKYCHLHADYDNNPPPRRGGVGSTTNATAAAAAAPLSSSLTTSKHNKAPSVAPDLRASSSFSSSDSSSATAAAASSAHPKKAARAPTDRSKRRSASSKLAKKHMCSSVPLLSMISTDQWADKRVKVSVGPLADRVGTVEKWSNGWVSVRIEGVGLHNRRSFELHLLDDDQDLPQELKKLMTTANKSSNNSTNNNDSEEEDSSRVTPSPRVTEDNPSSVKSVRPTVKLSIGAPVTPSPSVGLCSNPNTEDWPKTPASADLSDKTLPFVPSVTPSPRTKPMPTAKVTAAAGQVSERLSQGLLLSDAVPAASSATATTEAELSLDLRVEALQRQLSGVSPPLSARPMAPRETSSAAE